MTRKEFAKLVSKAEKGPVFENLQDVNAALIPFDGCALHNERFLATEKQVINFIRYQCLYLNGDWDMRELEECAKIARRIDLIKEG